MFSVIIPAYNAEKFIDNSIKSVLNQTYDNFELLIVDDGSIDETKSIVSKYDDNRIKYIYQKNAGVSSARNKGISESKNEYICFLDSDDEWKKDHLETMCYLVNKYNQCGLYSTGYDIRMNNGTIIHRSQYVLRNIHKDDFATNNGFDILNKCGYFLNTNTVCCKRDVFEKVGNFEVGVKNGEDDDMWYRIFTYYPIAVSKRVTTIYDRTNCVATGKREGCDDTPFSRRVETIRYSKEVPQEKKESIIVWFERNKLSQVRRCLILGNKKKAVKLFAKIKINKVSIKKYIETMICLIIPSSIIRQYVDKRDAMYYR